MNQSPAAFVPHRPEDFVGSAGIHARSLFAKADRMRDDRDAFGRAVFYGPPGTGKTELAKALGLYLAGHPLAIELAIGSNINTELVRKWTESGPGSLVSPWTIKILDEVEGATKDAMRNVRFLLDARMKNTFIIATTNVPLKELQEQLGSRAQTYKFMAVTPAELAPWLHTRWQLPTVTANSIASAVKGNVRAALQEAESYYDEQPARLTA